MRPFKSAKLLIACLVAVTTCLGQTPVPKFEIAPILFATGEKVDFRTSQTECDGQNVGNSIWQGDNFQIYSRPDFCQYDQDNQWFRYELFIKKSSSQQWFRSEVKAIPYGRFIDCYRDATFTITDGTTREQGPLRLPVHDLSNDPYLGVMITQDSKEVALEVATLEVKLGSDQALLFNLKNTLHDMPVVVTSAKVSYFQPALWASSTPEDFIDAKNILVVPQDQKAEINGRQIRPRALKAIQSTFFGSKSSNDSALHLEISYSAQKGGNPRQLSVPIKVRFVPSLVLLALAILIGAIIGTLGRLADPKARTSIVASLWSFLAALLGALILEALGIVLVSLNSEFKLFGIALDPFQFPQALVMAALVGVFGINITDIIKHMLGLDGGQQQVPENAGTQGGKI